MVGVSGGADSVCLLHLLRQLSSRRHLTLHVAHLNHGFRTEAAQEADFVQRLCDGWKIPATLSSLPVPRICKERHLSKQEGAREVRYAFLKEVAGATGARWIALGHTADDQAETFLMRLLRGSGSQGLGAIPRMRDGMIIRPLLSISRKQIVDELSREEIPFIEDPSNRQEIYLRNRVRHRLLPLLEEYNPKVKQTFFRETELLQEENDFLTRYTEELIPQLGIEKKKGMVSFDVERLQSLHPALQRRMVRWSLDQLHPGLKGIGFQHIETVLLKALTGQTGKTYPLPHQLWAEKGYTRLFLRKRDSKENQKGASRQSSRPEIILSPSANPIDLPEWGLRLTVSLHRDRERLPAFSTCAASFDFDRISNPLTLRRWRAGDYFVPTGMGGKHKKLQDLFVDAKVPKSQRASIPLLTCPEGILWVVGLRIDDRFRATEKSKKVLIVEAHALDRPASLPGVKPLPEGP
ncbi:MAG: tRNA lysidine(34) synthetase TilS [Candidatus Manganitrophus sp.]|nr:tRNA lysidine(34) synthetase TilS [Candidatus Manganitrophus sp.]